MVSVWQAAHNAMLENTKYAPIITFFIIFPLVKLFFLTWKLCFSFLALLNGIGKQFPQPHSTSHIVKFLSQGLGNPDCNLHIAAREFWWRSWHFVFCWLKIELLFVSDSLTIREYPSVRHILLCHTLHSLTTWKVSNDFTLQTSVRRWKPWEMPVCRLRRCIIWRRAHLPLPWLQYVLLPWR